jgi:hypothetical protein
MRLTHYILAAVAAIGILGAAPAAAQNSNGKVTTAPPSYTNNTWAPLSLTPTGELRVTSAGGGTGDVNINEVGGNPVTTALPVVGSTTVCDSAGTLAPVLPCADVSNVGGLNALAVNVVSGGGGGGGDVNLTEIGGTAVGTTVPGALDITCVSGCVAGSGVAQGTATAAAPTYTEGANAPLSLDLSGNQRVTLGAAQVNVACNIGVGCVGNAVGGAVPPQAHVVGFHDPSGNVAIPRTDGSGNTVVTGTVGITGTPNVALTSVSAGVGIIPIAPSTQAGTLSHSAILANSTNATSVKASAGTLFEISVYNNSATIAYLKLYNSATAPTCGSGTPVARYLIPGASSGGAGSNVNITLGKSFGTGIAYCVTTGIGDTDTTAVAANAYLVNLTYK